MAETRVELHPTTCSCRGGSWVMLGKMVNSACGGPRSPADTVTLSFGDWKSLGKPPNLDEYRRVSARAEGGERREYQRFEGVVKVRLSRIPSWRNESVQIEDTETEIIAKGGAFVRSRMALESGELILFELPGFRTRAEVRYVSRGGEAFQRLGLRFVDSLLPDELIPPGLNPV